MKQLTQERLKQVLHYNKHTGIFTRKMITSPSCKPIGSVVGSVNHLGYLMMSINNYPHLLHRLAWLYEYGYTPESCLDHINQKTTDNRICNLREASKMCNARNCGNPANNTSGVRGVVWDKARKKWHAQIAVMRKTIHFGYHSDFTEAVAHRLAAEQAENWHGCDSSSPAYKYMQEYLAK